MIRKFGTLLAGLVCVLCPAFLSAGSSTLLPYSYVSPRPGATRVNPQTSIALRFGMEPVVRSSLQSGMFFVVGSASGVHRGTVALSDDQRTVLFKPENAFQEGERVDVEIRPGVVTFSGAALPATSFSFSIRAPRTLPESSIRSAASALSDVASTRAANARRGPAYGRTSMAGSSAGPSNGALDAQRGRSTPSGAHAQVHGYSAPPSTASDSLPNPRRGHELPADFPSIRILKDTKASNNPVFLGSFSWGADTSAAYIMVLNRDGTPQYYRRGPGWDFTVQPNGLLTFYDEDSAYYVAMDSAYQPVDIYRCGNGYNTNEHELRILPNGHSYLMSYDGQEVAMDTIVPGGNPHALVFGLIIQELDLDKNVIFEWRSWDHFNIVDALHEDLTSADIDYVHGNAIEIDPDGNLLISSRNLDEITKINHETGDIIWRWGGVHNEFTFVNDPIGFEYQHAIRRLPNGNVILFDNGTFREFSRAVEYALDEEKRIATLVWQYRNAPDIWGWALGYAQRLPQGSTLVGWGSANPTATEVSATGEILFEFDLPWEVYTYRNYSFPWKTTAFVPAVDSLTFPSCAVGSSSAALLTINNPTAQDRYLTSLEPGTADFLVRTGVPVSVPAHGSATIDIAFQPGRYGTSMAALDLWSVDSTSGIMQRVILSGSSLLPQLVVAPSVVEFGETVKGDTARAVVTLSNNSPVSLTIDSIFTATSRFGVNRTSLSLVDSDSIVVTFTSLQAGVFTDTCSLRIVDPAQVVTISLKARCVAGGVSVVPGTVEFGEVTRGDSAKRIVTLKGLSAGILTLESAAVKGSPFSVRVDLPTIIRGRDSAAISVRFAPTAYGIFLDTLRLGIDGAVREIPLHGVSKDPSVGVDAEGASLPTAFLLAQNYPNPFNPTTVVNYEVPALSKVRLVLCDLLGREIAVLADGEKGAGRYAVSWNGTGMASGMYLCRMTGVPLQDRGNPAFVQVRKLLLVR